MRPLFRMLMITTLVLTSMPALDAQTGVDPSGHWEGTIQAPDRLVSVEIDLARNSRGQLAGTFTQPGDNVKGLPFATVVQEGRSVKLLLRAGSGGGTFTSTLSADGKTLEGDFIMNEGGYVLPFSATRDGDARIAPEPKSPPIEKAFEGTWSGALDVRGQQLRVSVTLANQPDGTATGAIAIVDGSGVSIPVAIAQEGPHLTLDVVSISATFAGTMNAAGTEIAGAWKQGGVSLPLTWRR
jgi:hypothetical protein